MGDDPRYPYPGSLFAFAHLGTEVKMRRKGTQSIVANNYAPQTSTAYAISRLPKEKRGVIPKGMNVPLWMKACQYIPLAGWMFSHFPGECQKDLDPDTDVLTLSKHALRMTRVVLC